MLGVDQPLTSAGSGLATLNRNHDLARGLAFYPWFGNGGPGVDLVSGTGPTSTAGNIGIGSRRGVFNPTTATLSWQEWSYTWVTQLLASKTEISLMVRYTARSDTDNKQGAFVGVCAANGSGYCLIQGDTVSGYGVYPNGGSPVYYNTIGNMQNGVTYTLFYSGGATNSRLMAFSGAGIIADRSVAALGTLSASLSRIRVAGERGTSAGGAGAVGAYANPGEVHAVAIWNRRLAVTEMVALSQNPYAFVTRKGRSSVAAFSTAGRWGISSGIGLQ